MDKAFEAINEYLLDRFRENVNIIRIDHLWTQTDNWSILIDNP